jgi:hypothetical protein
MKKLIYYKNKFDQLKINSISLLALKGVGVADFDLLRSYF